MICLPGAASGVPPTSQHAAAGTLKKPHSTNPGVAIKPVQSQAARAQQAAASTTGRKLTLSMRFSPAAVAAAAAAARVSTAEMAKAAVAAGLQIAPAAADGSSAGVLTAADPSRAPQQAPAASFRLPRPSASAGVATGAHSSAGHRGTAGSKLQPGTADTAGDTASPAASCLPRFPSQCLHLLYSQEGPEVDWEAAVPCSRHRHSPCMHTQQQHLYLGSTSMHRGRVL